MSYAGERTILDADSHVMEVGGWLDDFIDPKMKDRVKYDLLDMLGPRISEAVEEFKHRKRDPKAAAAAAERVMTDKSWSGLGAFDSEERSTALDLLGFEGQLILPTFGLGLFGGGDPELREAGASALNHKMASFCGSDDRLHAVGYVPLNDPESAAKLAQEAVALGCKAIWSNHVPVGGRAPTHPDLDGFWEVLNSQNVPFVLHAGGAGQPGTLTHKDYNNNGRPIANHFGPVGEGLGARDSLAVDHAAQIFLGALIFDAHFEKFPDLRCGVIEQGAAWVVSWLRRLDGSFETFSKFDDALKALNAKPSEYVRKHIKFTPGSSEDVGWLIEQTYPELYMFSTDYPHPEGGTKPLHHFDESLKGVDQEKVERFYAGNMRELLTGSAVA